MIKDPVLMYVIVRLDKKHGGEWMDFSTLTASREVAVFRAEKFVWATANPVQRIARVEIREIEERS